MIDFPEIPDALKRTRGDQEPLKGKRLRWTRDMHFAEKRTIPADVLAFKKEHERAQKQKREERFKMLRERAAEMKRKAVRA